MHCLHLWLFVVLTFTISLSGSNKVRENINAVLISEVQFPFNSHSMSGSLSPFSLLQLFFLFGIILITANCYAYQSKSETNSAYLWIHSGFALWWAYHIFVCKLFFEAVLLVIDFCYVGRALRCKLRVLYSFQNCRPLYSEVFNTILDFYRIR